MPACEGRPPAISPSELGQVLFERSPMPICAIDSELRIVGLNGAAEALWGCKAGSLLGTAASDALGIEPLEPGGASADGWAVVLEALATGKRVPCRITARDGRVHVVSLASVPVRRGRAELTVIFILDVRGDGDLVALPDWALTDPGTGLANRHHWSRELDMWDRRGGTVLFFDLDDLKQINDLYGHLAGDKALAAVGRTLREQLPADSLAVRYGGDEFVAVVPALAAEEAQALARRVNESLSRLAKEEGHPVVPQLRHGAAAFEPGGLLAAVQAADEALYEAKGVLLRSARGGALVLLRRARTAAQFEEEPRPGAFGTAFGPEFAEHFRAQYARSVEEAREFVAFAAPEPGTAVIEVAAGAGRITFDGGLTDRVGPSGQLLVTDPSPALLNVARQQARQRGYLWVRFLEAPAEDLPVASGCADLILGDNFLQFCDPAAVARELARVARPGGRIALSTGLEFPWPAAWQEILEPVERALAAAGLPLPAGFPFTPGQLRGILASAGLEILADEVTDVQRLDFPSTPVCIGFLRQTSFVRQLMRALPAAPRIPVEEAVEARVAEVFPRTHLDERAFLVRFNWVQGRRPGQADA